jgi:hypothetical protein
VPNYQSILLCTSWQIGLRLWRSVWVPRVAVSQYGNKIHIRKYDICAWRLSPFCCYNLPLGAQPIYKPNNLQQHVLLKYETKVQKRSVRDLVLSELCVLCLYFSFFFFVCSTPPFVVCDEGVQCLLREKLPPPASFSPSPTRQCEVWSKTLLFRLPL